MAIIFAASELEAFMLNVTGSTTATSTAGEFDGGTARAGVDVDQTADLIIPVAGGLAEGWLHFNCWHSQAQGVGAHDFVLFKDTVGGDDGVFRLDPDGNNIDLDILNSSPSTYATLNGAFIDLTADSNEASTLFNWDNLIQLNNQELTTFDFHWWMHDTTGVFEVWINGIDYNLGTPSTNDTLRAANTSVDEIRLSSGSTSARNVIFSEVIVADEDTRGMRVATIDPDGAGGTNTAWANGVTEIDEASGSVATIDSDSITSNTTGQIEQFTGSAMPTGDYEVLGLCVGFRGKDDASGVQQVRASVRTGAADFNGATQAMTTAFDGYFEMWELNPNTVAKWTVSEIDGVEYGVESIT